jgi:hypothetical protein
MLGDVDTIELKHTVPADHHRATIGSLGLDPLNAQIRQVYFFDTPDLALNAAGVVVRARRIQGKGNDSVVKLRPVAPAELSSEIRSAPGFGVEIDAMVGGFVCSGTMKQTLKPTTVREAVTGNRPLKKLFSKRQRAFYAKHAPDDVGLDSLSVLGPVFVLKLKEVPEGFERPLVSELWLYPDGSRILELSTKCLPSETFEVAAATREFLVSHDIPLGGTQQTKTKTALEFFSAQLKQPA